MQSIARGGSTVSRRSFLAGSGAAAFASQQISAAAPGLSLTPEDMKWWRDARFGMFIHWGIYSVLGHGEWAQWFEQIDVREYAKLAERFRPQAFDADAWAAAARDAGMKYMVLTARHHDGFCLFDSQVSDFTSVKTAARRDFVAEYVRACRKAGLGVGLYYSPLDWRFPGFFLPGIYRESAEAMKKQTYDQVRELLTNYGKIDILWFDGGGDDWLGFGGLEYWGGKWHSRDAKQHYTATPLWEPEKLYRMIRQLQPKIVMNDRAGTPGVDWGGDFHTPERKVGQFDTERRWETCDVLAESWGYVPNEPIRSFRNCVQLLVQTAVNDGNLLLNVGPRPDGAMEPHHVRRLKEVGEWLKRYGESIYGTRGGPVHSGPWGGVTHRDNRLYVHVIDWVDDTIELTPIPGKIVAARSLTGREIKVEKTAIGIRLTVPPEDRQAVDTIVLLETDQQVA
ncbi:MAG: alpha-L-fucosidase [Acidobacteriia bacterium]|nr:alpha-L-fucosidase [Terriglobia bacterium]